MKVAIVGAGGVGGFVGGALARAGHEVAVLARGAHLQAISERGLQVESGQIGTFTARVSASDTAADLGRADLVVIAVKMYDFEAACRAAGELVSPNGVALTLQNGLDAPFELASHIGAERVLIGTMRIEAAIKEPGVVAHMNAAHQVTVAELNGPPGARVENLVSGLAGAGLNALAVADGQQALWEKAAILIPLATITSAGDLVSSDIQDSLELRRLYADLRDEFIALARANGRDVTPALAWMQQQLAAVPTMTSSMNRDFRAGRPVELEWLTGKVVHLAEEQGVPVPAHAALYALLKVKAQRLAASR